MNSIFRQVPHLTQSKNAVNKGNFGYLIKRLISRILVN
jgi:hypothetical protein